jgi:hypothetical protein
MSKPTPTNTSPETSELFEAAMKNAEMPWRAWGDPAGFGTLYQMGYDAWKTWADMQLSMLDACWKMGCLTLDVPAAAEERRVVGDDTTAERVQLQVRLKKVSGAD